MALPPHKMMHKPHELNIPEKEIPQPLLVTSKQLSTLLIRKFLSTARFKLLILSLSISGYFSHVLEKIN